MKKRSGEDETQMPSVFIPSFQFHHNKQRYNPKSSVGEFTGEPVEGLGATYKLPAVYTELI